MLSIYSTFTQIDFITSKATDLDNPNEMLILNIKGSSYAVSALSRKVIFQEETSSGSDSIIRVQPQ